MRLFTAASAAFFMVILSLVIVPVAHAGLRDRVNEAFRSIHNRPPTVSEWTYWVGRVDRKEKTTFGALVGAIAYQFAQKGGSPSIATGSKPSAPNVDAASGFAINKISYASPQNPNALPDGTLIKSVSGSEVYIVRGGKKSWVLPSLLNRWLNENHFFKHDIIITLSDADFARYPQTSSVNSVYVGKVLQHPNGTQFFIDDKLRKRQLSASVRSAFKIPSGNNYGTSAAHISEFKTGPALKADTYPGGFVAYSGAYHGGRIWRFKEAAGGSIRKHLYLSDYLYEADGNPDESLRAAAVSSIFEKHARGSNIEKYPDGWVVGLGNNIYVVHKEKLRLIVSPQLFDAMGYKQKYVLTRHPEFLNRYAKGEAIRAYKNLAIGGVSASKGAPAAAPNAAAGLTKVRPNIRALIAQVNDLYLLAYGKDVSGSENKFWVDYVYAGEVTTKEDLLAKMRSAAASGKKPARTSRTASRSVDEMKSKWLPYLFYFVHGRDPNEDEKGYWHDRIEGGKRSIEGLGGTIQWLKDTQNKTFK